MRRLFAILALLAGLLSPLSAADAANPPVQATASTYTNPIGTNRSDPHVIKYGGKYYLTSTDGCGGSGSSICVWESSTITGLGSGTRHGVWKAPACPAINCTEIWAPEIHFINNNFYIYYAADGGTNADHRIFALQSTNGTPAGPYAEASTGFAHGKLQEASDRWAIDFDIFRGADNRLYGTWSGWTATTGDQQNLYIAPMSDPLHFSGPRVQISAPTRPWEVVTYKVNEGPVGFVRGGRTFIAYSASACWDTSYAVGLLTNTSGNLLDPNAWTKTGPHFKWHSGVKANASFVPVQTQDGTEDWFLFHSNTAGCDPQRVLRAQRMFWDPDGTPVLGYPIADGVPIQAPKGELGSAGYPNPYQQGWGDAFGDLSEGDTGHGRRVGSWTVVSPTEARITSPGGTTWTQLFRAANPNYETYTVSVDVQWTGTGTTSSFPKYGIHASYDDRNNNVQVFIDRKYMVLATHAVVGGTEAAWQNANLPAGFDPAAWHNLRVRKSGTTYQFYLDGALLQTRTFTGSFPVLLNGQVGLVTEDTTANYRNLRVYDTW